MKKIISLVLVVLLICTQVLTGVCAASNATITIDNKTIQQGDTVELYLKLSNSPEVKSLILYDFDWDSEALSLQKAELLVSGAAMSDCDQSTAETVFAFNENTNCEGNLLKLTFKASANSIGTKSISCSAVIKKMVNGIETTVESTVKNGSVTISERPKQTIKGVTLTDKTFTYDGTEKTYYFI